MALWEDKMLEGHDLEEMILKMNGKMTADSLRQGYPQRFRNLGLLQKRRGDWEKMMKPRETSHRTLIPQLRTGEEDSCCCWNVWRAGIMPHCPILLKNSEDEKSGQRKNTEAEEEQGTEKGRRSFNIHWFITAMKFIIIPHFKLKSTLSLTWYFS